jgi:hypothetical protein
MADGVILARITEVFVGDSCSTGSLLELLAQIPDPRGRHGRRQRVEKTGVELLKTIVLKGRLVTGDAMFCQRELCEEVVDSGGDY